MRVTASAPGKVVIIGEYAVLEGAPALVMAVDRRVRVDLREHGESYCSVTSPGWTGDGARFHLEAPDRVTFEAGSGAFALVEHVIGEFCRRSGGLAERPFELVMDSGALTEAGPAGPTKLGLGSSAALTVALCAALSYHAAVQHDSRRGLDLRALVDIHSGLQERRGSGLDVAASLHGGLIEYRRLPTPVVCGARLPEDVQPCFVWSGRHAATGDFLAGLARWRQEKEKQYTGLMNNLAELAEAGLAASLANQGDEFLRVMDEYTIVLEGLGNAAGADIVSEPHRRLRSIAKAFGVVYKPCGAGGGDVGVGMTADAGALAAFRQAIVADEFQSLTLNVDRQGVQVRSEN